MNRFFDSPSKRILIPLIIFIVLFLGILLTAFLNLGSLVNRNKDVILSQAETKLDRKVAVDTVDVSVWGGLSIQLKNISMSDDLAFSNQKFIQSADARIDVAWLPLLQGKLQINRLVLKQPEILIVLDEKGQYNFSTVGKKEEKIEKAPAKEPAALELSYLDIVDGNITIQNKLEKKESKIKKINITAKNLGLDQKINLVLSAAALSEKKNFEFKGNIGPIGSTFDFNKLPLDGSIEVTELPVETLEKTFPNVKEVIPKELGLSGLITAKTNLSGNGGNISFSQIRIQTTVFGEKKTKPEIFWKNWSRWS